MRSLLPVTALAAALLLGGAARTRGADDPALRLILLGTGDARGWTDPCG